jgi:hypothetical protein
MELMELLVQVVVQGCRLMIRQIVVDGFMILQWLLLHHHLHKGLELIVLPCHQ